MALGRVRPELRTYIPEVAQKHDNADEHIDYKCMLQVGQHVRLPALRKQTGHSVT